MNYVVHMTPAERTELERRAADADTRIAAGTEPLDTLMILTEEVRAVRRVLAWADQTKVKPS